LPADAQAPGGGRAYLLATQPSVSIVGLVGTEQERQGPLKVVCAPGHVGYLALLRLEDLAGVNEMCREQGKHSRRIVADLVADIVLPLRGLPLVSLFAGQR